MPELDLIIGGHSHTPLTSALREGNAWIVQAGSYGRSVGDIWIQWGPDGLESFIYDLVDLSDESIQESASRGMIREVRRYERALEKRYGESVGSSSEALSRGYDHESQLGNWIADVLRAQTGADLGLYNGGGLRSDLPSGELTRGDLEEIFGLACLA